MNMKKGAGHAKGFTLLELLIVISIIAILSVALVLILNPAETLKKSRDTQRISDLNTIKTALGLYLTSTSTPWMNGNTDVACAPWSSSTTTLSVLTDGTGWLPINLNSLTSGSPISSLPVDPVNSGAMGYAYKCNNTAKTFEVSAVLESSEYSPRMLNATDGGTDDTRYEVGTNLAL
ncbi:MAG: type II secretion system protein [bacterium]|nr:type II secretion system protein [bacterium]